MGVKKFKSLLRKHAHKEDFQVLHLMEINNLKHSKVETVDTELPPHIQQKKDKLLQKYKSVFRSELPEGLPPKRSVDHEILVDENAKPPHRTLFQLSPAELMATKDYVTDLLRKGKSDQVDPPMGLRFSL